MQQRWGHPHNAYVTHRLSSVHRLSLWRVRQRDAIHNPLHQGQAHTEWFGVPVG